MVVLFFLIELGYGLEYVSYMLEGGFFLVLGVKIVCNYQTNCVYIRVKFQVLSYHPCLY